MRTLWRRFMAWRIRREQRKEARLKLRAHIGGMHYADLHVRRGGRTEQHHADYLQWLLVAAFALLFAPGASAQFMHGALPPVIEVPPVAAPVIEVPPATAAKEAIVAPDATIAAKEAIVAAALHEAAEAAAAAKEADAARIAELEAALKAVKEREAAALPLSVIGAPMPVIVDDPLAAGTGAEGWVWAMRYWSPPAEPRDLAGGRIQAQIGVGRWGYAFRGDISGLPGEFSPDKPETFRSLEGHLAVHRNFAGAQGVKLGAAVGAGAGFSLEKQEGVAPVTPHSATAGVGLHASGPGWWAYALFGQHQSLPGFAGIVTYQVRASERTAAVGTFAVGEHGSYIAQFGVAVRWF